MSLSEHDHDMTRRYLLGQLTDDEEQLLEERLLSEDDFFQEVELAKDELAQEYVSGQLTAKEGKWLQDNFLASPEGKQRHEFAKTFDHYVRKHRPQRQKSPSLFEWLWKLWNSQPQLLRAASTVAILVIVVVLIIPQRGPRSVATLTVLNNPQPRSAVGGPVTSVRLKEDELKLTLMLPQFASPGSPFRVDLLRDNNVQTFNTTAQDTQSVSVVIPKTQLPRGEYAAVVSAIDANGKPQRMPGYYYFQIE